MRFLENGSFVSKKLQQFFNFVFFVVQHLERLDVLDCVNFFLLKSINETNYTKNKKVR